jgi:hypothetical protein
MTGKPRLVIEPLHPTHDRVGFVCGVPALDRYLQRQAGQDVKRRFSRVFICVEQETPQNILGFYTLSALSIETPTLPLEIARRFPIGPCACFSRLPEKRIRHAERRHVSTPPQYRVRPLRA